MENTLLTEIKKPRDYITKIHVVESNFKYIATTGRINGTLLLEIEKCMELYAKQFQEIVQTDVLITEIMVLREKNADLVEMLKYLKDCRETWSNLFQSDKDRIESLINSNITE